ncbi:Arf-GAP with coiled-coil, partial [Nibea albiflora]
QLVKQCQAMLEAGRVYCQTSKSFVNGLRELGLNCSGDKMMEDVIDVTQKAVKTKLQTFVKEDVRRFKDVRKEFERSSECLEGALSRNAQAPRGKQHEVEEASNALLNARRAFRSEAMDYVLEINVIEAKKKTDILMAMLSLMEAQAQFFQNGHQSLSDLDEYRRKLSEEHTQFVLDSAREKRDMEQRHAAIKKKDVSYDDSIMDFHADAANGIAMEGYLYKRASNAFKTWSRRWFTIQKNQLVYQKKFKDQPTVVVEDLRLCTVKPSAENERRFCFEVVSPSKDSAAARCRRAVWEAGEEEEEEERTRRASLGVHFSKVRSLTLDSWEPELIKLMCELGNTVINRIYEARIDEITIKKPHASSPRGDKESWIRSKYVEKKFIQKLPETGRNPLLRRSSARRNRATTQDRSVQRPPIKPKPNRATLPRVTGLSPSDLVQKNNTSFHKDVEEEEEDLSGLHPGALLYRSAALQNFPVMADALAHGADVNWVNMAEESSTPLIQAVSANALAACEFLLQNGANVNQADSNGRRPLHHATILGHTGLVCLFLKRGADYNAKDKNQKDPITIAVDNANADIVTLLRIAKMNKEMREMDGAFGQSGHSGGQGSGGLLGGTGGDETYQDIFRDFSQMASNNPEKLKRRSADPKN